jgi:hypothetical protein
LSEDGYFYNKHDKINGELLVFESAGVRNGLRTLNKLPKMVSSSGVWELEGSLDQVLLEDGSGFVTLDETEPATLIKTAKEYERVYGSDISNSVKVTAYPKRVDTVEQTLFALGAPIKIEPKEVKTITVSYTNLATKERCNAISELCAQPVPTLDYLMYNAPKGGSSIVGNLVISVVFHSATADIRLENAGIAVGYITKLLLKGFGVYQDSSIQFVLEDAASIAYYGYREVVVEQQYQKDLVMGGLFAAKTLHADKDPHTKLKIMSMYANNSDQKMMAFLNLDVGDIAKIENSDLGLSGHYYIQGISFDLIGGEVILFRWVLKETLVFDELTEVAIEIQAANSRIEFLPTPKMTQFSAMTLALTCTIKEVVNNSVVISKTSASDSAADNSGFRIQVSTVPALGFQVYAYEASHYYYYAIPNCYFPAGVVPVVDTEYRLLITTDKNRSWTVGFFIDGVSMLMSYGKGYDANVYKDTGNNFVIGANAVGATIYRDSAKMVAKRLRMWDRVLDAGEIAADFAGLEIERSCIFRGVYIKNVDTTAYYDAALSEAQKVFELMNLNIGTPYNSPICREII